MSNEFTCANCGQTFGKKRSEEETRAEYREIFEPLGFAPLDEEEVVVVCDDCWQKIKPVGALA